jgi:riboflavin synthase
MFTGIVESKGTLRAASETDTGRHFAIEAADIVEALDIGASVAVSGACLTVVATSNSGFTVELVPETLRRTALGDLVVGDSVNLELAMPAAGRFDGHIVQGHVDGVGLVRSLTDHGDGLRLSVECPPELRKYIVTKGSITIDGVSLTVAGIDEEGFEVALIPHTSAVTTLGSLSPSDRVNLEVDILAKYVERLLETRA